MAPDVVLRVHPLVFTWDQSGPTLAIYRRDNGGTPNAGAVKEDPLFSFVGQEAKDAATVFMVANMRGGQKAVFEALHEVFAPRPESNIAAGMFFAERDAYRRQGGKFIRDMEV